MNPKIYEFSTFEELYERVPTERIADCLKELGIGFEFAKRNQKFIDNVAESIGRKTPTTKPDFSKPLKWVDDGAKEISFNLRIDGELIYQTKLLNGEIAE